MPGHSLVVQRKYILVFINTKYLLFKHLVNLFSGYTYTALDDFSNICRGPSMYFQQKKSNKGKNLHVFQHMFFSRLKRLWAPIILTTIFANKIY